MDSPKHVPPTNLVKDQWMRPKPFSGVMRSRFWRTSLWEQVVPTNSLCVALMVPKENRVATLESEGVERGYSVFEAPLFQDDASQEGVSRAVYYDPRLAGAKTKRRVRA